MSKSERMLLIKMFSEQRPQQFKDQTFNYAAFCEILQVCSMSAVHPQPPPRAGPKHCTRVRLLSLDTYNHSLGSRAMTHESR